ncbi:hypothetical protein CVS40_0995 [Lucilia cuprina]|nr:hypothetical protein CVS40_0995 [Lucilia cuprina]
MINDGLAWNYTNPLLAHKQHAIQIKTKNNEESFQVRALSLFKSFSFTLDIRTERIGSRETEEEEEPTRSSKIQR